jgi:cobalt/nickel transport system permease protein
MLLLHLGITHLGLDSQGTTVWHRLTPQTRVLIVLLAVLATVLTPVGQWWTWALYGGGLALLILLSQVTLSVLVQRIALESIFVGVVLVGTLFQPGTDVLWQWGPVQITGTGLMLLGSVSFKSLLCLGFLNLLVLTATLPELLQALTVLRLPPLLVAILTSMTRYITLLIEEVTSLRRAALSRNLMGRRYWQRLVVGNLIGSLFIRTYERGDRIHQAMLARGFTGSLPLAQALPQLRLLDGCALLLTGLVIVAGQRLAWR